MVSSACRTISCIVLVLGAAGFIQAQTTTEKVATASISGKVTIKDKPAVAVMVAATDTSYGYAPTKSRRATTDETGNYRIANLPAGTYQITAVTPSLVPTQESISVVVSEGEEVDDIDLSLVPGGVITGKISDSEGRPVIAEHVSIAPVYDRTPNSFVVRTTIMRIHGDNTTDDRGVYRIFGLPPGKYRVSVGQSGLGMLGSRGYYKKTFYPSVTDDDKATVIEVTEGSETKDIDIVLGPPLKTFRIAGRVVDGETGRPAPNVEYGVGQRIELGRGARGVTSRSGDVTNANGEFRLENATPGTYTIFTVPPAQSDIPSASVTFDVVDRDVTDLIIKTIKGSSLSGVVAIDGNQGPPSTFSRLRVCASTESSNSSSGPKASAVGQDGTFSINGVRSGRVHISLCSAGDNREHFQIVRVERSGIPQSEAINVKEREHVAGLRVVVKYRKLTGVVRGQVKVENGELPPGSDVSLSLWPLDENLQPRRTSSISSPQVDARGRFVSYGLPAGAYQLTVYLYTSPPGPSRTFHTTKQQVTVSDDTVTEVTLVVKPQSSPE